MKKIHISCTRARCGKILKHFLGQGPEAPRFTRAGRARARARAKYPEIFTRFLHLLPIIGAAQELLWPKITAVVLP